MELILYNRIIDTDIEEIITKLKIESEGKYFRDIKRKSEYISISCPFHKDGQEHKPSCSVYNKSNNPKIVYGTFNCFTCHEKGPLYKLVAKSLNISYEEAKHWLIDNFSSTYEDKRLVLDDFEMTSSTQNNYLDESILEQFSYFHPYQFKRGLTEEVIRKFKIGYNQKTNAITFPVWDDTNHLIGITERSVVGKQFYIPKNFEKPVYLLNYIKQNNITEVIVCEGPIDALVSWSRGFPAVALFGAGTTDKQIELLNHSGIRHFILMYDNDLAGQHGALRLKTGLYKDKMITEIIMPKGKDIASCTTEEFINILKDNGINTNKMYLHYI